MAANMRSPPAVKVTLLGESGAGKSSIVLQQTKGSFQPNQETTIGAAYVTYTPPEGNVKLEIWCERPRAPGTPDTPLPCLTASRRDTAGQERYASLAPMYYRCAPLRPPARARTLLTPCLQERVGGDHRVRRHGHGQLQPRAALAGGRAPAAGARHALLAGR